MAYYRKHAPVISRLADPPANPTYGDRHLVIAPATGVWAGYENTIFTCDLASTWVPDDNDDGSRVWVTGESKYYYYDNSAWTDAPNVGLQATIANSAQLLAAVADATGGGLAVFNNAPTLTNPVIGNISPAGDFTLTQNGVAILTSIFASGAVNTLYLKAGKVGIGTADPQTIFHIFGAAALLRLQRDSAGVGASFGQFYNPNATDGCAIDLTWLTDTTGAGATAAASMSYIRHIYTTHDHATRKSSLQFATSNSGGATVRLTISPDGTLTLTSGVVNKRTEVAAATYNLLATDYLLHVTYTATGACQINLPTAQLVSGRTIVVMDAGGLAGTNNITVATDGAETINGAATLVIAANYAAKTIYPDGANWFAY